MHACARKNFCALATAILREITGVSLLATDFVVAESCLDSMPLDVAKNYISELKRVCSGVIYASLIGPDESMGSNEFEVQTLHEFGTYQTVFNKEKIASLFGSNISNFSYFASISCMDVQSKKIGSKRFHCVIESEKIYG